MTAYTVTSTITANGSNGMVLRVYVLTGAAATQNGATATQSANAAHNASITTTTTGSQVYGACLSGAATAPTVFNSSTTAIDAVTDSGHTKCYATCKATSTTGTPGAITLGYTDSNNGGIALYEVLPAGTIAQDASSPAVVSTTAAQTLTTASFTPPAGSVLIALVATNGASNTVVTNSVTSSPSLTWTAQATANASNMKYAAVWTAAIPAAPIILSPVAVLPARRLSQKGTVYGINHAGTYTLIPQVSQPPVAYWMRRV